MIRRPPRSTRTDTLFPYSTLFRSDQVRPLKRQTFDEAADALRVALKHAIGSWSTCFDQILVGISGGLDSSIVAAALGPRTPHLRSEERRVGKECVSTCRSRWSPYH